MYKKYRYLNTDIHIYEQGDEELRLLQHDRLAPLSWLRNGNDKPRAVINCSYFTPQWVLGRNQGDLRNDTHDQEGFYDLVFTSDEKYHIGNYKSWDYTSNVIAGFSVASVLVLGGQDVKLVSNAICGEDKITSRNPQTCIGVLNTGKVLFIVSDGRSSLNKGLTGLELRDFIKSKYNIELLCQLDGGGSSEMMVDGLIKNKPSDGRERNMWNGLAFIEKADKPIENELIKEDLIDKSKYDIKCPFGMKPTYITIHNTANNVSARAEIDYMKANYNEVSYHVAVDDKEAIQGISFNRNAWHCGDGINGIGNRNSIGIEICYSTDYDTDRFDKAFMRTVEVTKYLMEKFNIPVENVVQHNHWNGKDCPHRIRKEGTWDKFINLLGGNNDLETKIKALESEIATLKESHEKEVNTLKTELNQAIANLKAINQYANEIVKISN